MGCVTRIPGKRGLHTLYDFQREGFRTGQYYWQRVSDWELQDYIMTHVEHLSDGVFATIHHQRRAEIIHFDESLSTSIRVGCFGYFSVKDFGRRWTTSIYHFNMCNICPHAEPVDSSFVNDLSRKRILTHDILKRCCERVRPYSPDITYLTARTIGNIMFIMGLHAVWLGVLGSNLIGPCLPTFSDRPNLFLPSLLYISRSPVRCPIIHQTSCMVSLVWLLSPLWHRSTQLAWWKLSSRFERLGRPCCLTCIFSRPYITKLLCIGIYQIGGICRSRQWLLGDAGKNATGVCCSTIGIMSVLYLREACIKAESSHFEQLWIFCIIKYRKNKLMDCGIAL